MIDVAGARVLARAGLLTPVRPDRLVGMLVPAFFADVLDLWILLEVALWALAVAATVTVAQRIWVVRRQALARAASQA